MLFFEGITTVDSDTDVDRQETVQTAFESVDKRENTFEIAVKYEPELEIIDVGNDIIDNKNRIEDSQHIMGKLIIQSIEE
jgi:hypothetical protein